MFTLIFQVLILMFYTVIVQLNLEINIKLKVIKVIFKVAEEHYLFDELMDGQLNLEINIKFKVMKKTK